MYRNDTVYVTKINKNRKAYRPPSPTKYFLPAHRHSSHRLFHFWKDSWKSFPVRVSSTPCDSAGYPQRYQNGVLPVSISLLEIGMQHSLLSKNLKIKIHRNIILSVVLYGCETWSLTMREGRRLTVFDNRL
jgi:hypothetical protein